MEFAVKIRLEGAAMTDGADIAAVLRGIAGMMEYQGVITNDHLQVNRVRDVNGNTVGEWSITNE